MSQTDNARKISVSEMAPHVHTFLPGENKVNKISDWLEKWIISSLKAEKIKYNDYLPKKGELAFHIGVSLGTIQNVYRKLEDKGIIESRQKVGAYIKDSSDSNLEKLTSKREVTIEKIKNFIYINDCKIGDTLLSARKLSKNLIIPFATIISALNRLELDGIIEKSGKNYIIKQINYQINNIEQETLSQKIAERINDYIKENLKTNDKLPSNNTLADMFNISIKTINDAMKILSAAGIIKTRRGYYGTIVNNNTKNNNDTYYYEQVEQCIKKYIAENCKINDKLPSIKNFAEVFNVSAKTIKNALDNLNADGYINFVRGKYGGTFVINIPTSYDKSYTWLALSPEFEQTN